MELTWDERKRLSNLDKHGLDFKSLPEGFLADAVVRTSRHGRLVAIGRLADAKVVTVILAPLGSEAMSVISMRPASKKERAIAT